MKKLAFELKNGEKIVCLNGQYIYLDKNWNYLPSESENNTLISIDNTNWVSSKKLMKRVFELSKEQEMSVLQAFNDREAYFSTKKDQINKISIKDILLLDKLPSEKLFTTIMLWLEYFDVFPENQKFREELGFALFSEQVCFVKKLEPVKQEEVIKIFRRRFNQGLSEELQKMIRVCLLGSYESQKRKLLAFKNSKINSFVLD